jgi:hypothetical protein
MLGDVVRSSGKQYLSRIEAVRMELRPPLSEKVFGRRWGRDSGRLGARLDAPFVPIEEISKRDGTRIVRRRVAAEVALVGAVARPARSAAGATVGLVLDAKAFGIEADAA